MLDLGNTFSMAIQPTPLKINTKVGVTSVTTCQESYCWSLMRTGRGGADSDNRCGDQLLLPVPVQDVSKGFASNLHTHRGLAIYYAG